MQRFNMIDEKYEVLSFEQDLSENQTVFKAKCKKTSNVVLIKRITNVLQDSQECQRIIREISVYR